jgi:hypothetical protein
VSYIFSLIQIKFCKYRRPASRRHQRTDQSTGHPAGQFLALAAVQESNQDYSKRDDGV